MILIVGLGNPGVRYQNSRHNLGFMVLDKLAKDLLSVKKTKWEVNKKAEALTLRVLPEVILVQPQNFMNASGATVTGLVRYYKLEVNQLFVIHDDVDLPLGKIKIRLGGASAGHHGVESIIEKLGTDKFWRIRLGIGKPTKKGKSVEHYVLGDFLEGETGKAKNMIEKTVKVIRMVIDEGVERAMNKYN